TGARGLRSIIERTLEDAMYDVPGDDAVSEVIVDAEAVDGARGPRIVSDGRRAALRLERTSA
ncbi:MAG: ATP-dependent Clp protease ATP-binding subunit ClpX, partial [Bifidobacterium castoris]|nr:ATP-dependent Clp protease ATP-binding subunit ClpX [Bifidobacterium castoris]